MVLWKETAFPLCRATKRRWKKECCLPDVFCDSGDTPANLLCELRGHLMPGTSCLYGKRVEDVCAGQFGVFVYLVLRCLVGCCTWFSCYYYLSMCLTRRYYRSVRSCAVCAEQVPGGDIACWNLVSQRSAEIRRQTPRQRRRHLPKQIHSLSAGESEVAAYSIHITSTGPILRNFSGCTISKVHVWCNALTLSKVSTS